MGFIALGMVSTPCKGEFKNMLEDVTKMSVSGLMNPHPRVRHAALHSTACLCIDLAPHLQGKFVNDLLPALIKMVNEEESLRLQYKASACMTSFIGGLFNDEEVEDDERKDTC